MADTENISNTSDFVDDIYQELTDEFQQIRTCMTMYISKDQTDGAMHLLKEIVNNALDECTNENSPSRKVDITFNEDTNEFIVADQGRGIPFEKLVKVCMTKHTSTKFDRDKKYSKDQAGRNGVGLTVTTALSDYLSISSYRGTEMKSIDFIDGVLREFPIDKLKKEQHGTIVKFIPSEKYLGQLDITTDLVENYLRSLSYILRPDLKICFYGKKKGFDKLVTRTYTYQGLSANVKFISATLEFEPVDIFFANENFDMVASFSYDKTLDESIINSYCNYVITLEGGNHEIAAQRSICEFFCREAKKLEPNSKFEITYDDCKKGLILCVNCRHVNPVFEGQHKSKISNRDLLTDGKKGLNDAIYKFFSNNNGLLRKIITYLRQISKARSESNKIKGVPNKKNTTFLDDADIKEFNNISDRNYSGYKELIISEGESASGAILNARNSKYQAVFYVMGVVNNVFSLTTAQLLQKHVFGNLVNILGCGIGKDFNIAKLRWNKIIICTDADVDGSNITSLVSCFFLLFMKELLDAGVVYKALPPLYLINTKPIRKYYKGEEWIFDKNEYYELFHTLISDNVEICIPDINSKNNDVEKLSKKQKMELLDLNSEYLIELESLVKRAACLPIILEYVCYYHLLSAVDSSLNGYSEAKFKHLIETQFNELTYDLDEQTLIGSYKGENISLFADKIFIRGAKRFIQILAQNKSLIIYCKNKNSIEDKYDKMTIGQFLSLMGTQFNIQITQRFKGLGEVETPILFATTINPKARKLIRLTVGNLDEALKIFKVLHGKGDEMREERRVLLDEGDFKLSDIDN